MSHPIQEMHRQVTVGAPLIGSREFEPYGRNKSDSAKGQQRLEGGMGNE